MADRLWWRFLVLLIATSLVDANKEDDEEGEPVNIEENLVVEMESGELLGTQLYIPDNDKPAYAFLGVPYAQPPIDDLRFMPPKVHEPWDGIMDATKYGRPCPQALEFTKDNLQAFSLDLDMDPATSEACLSLDIYSPSLTGKHPVMVFVHGGGFDLGFSSAYDGRAYAIVEDVLVVVIQYRLGIMGFLSTGDKTVPGNMGIQDQVAALEWVQRNIAKFGGDPEQVTLAGHGTGGMCVSLLTLYPESKGLFKRVILQSGGLLPNQLLNFPAVVTNSLEKVAKAHGCDDKKSKKIIKCLQDIPANVLLDTSSNPIYQEIADIVWFPSIDDKFITGEPIHMVVEGSVHKDLDVLAGVCPQEGMDIVNSWYPETQELGFDKKGFRKKVTSAMSRTFPAKEEEKWKQATDMVMKEYKEKGKSYSELYSEFMGDLLIGVETYRMALITKGKVSGNVFFYEMAQHYSKAHHSVPNHGEDLFFTFGSSYTGTAFGTKVNYSDSDKEMDRIMFKYWANFIRKGNPNGDDLVTWLSFKNKEQPYMKLTVNPEIGETKYREKRLRFWTHGIPMLMIKHVDAPGTKTVKQTVHVDL